jgi:hypothetical protein
MNRTSGISIVTMICAVGVFACNQSAGSRVSGTGLDGGAGPGLAGATDVAGGGMSGQGGASGSSSLAGSSGTGTGQAGSAAAGAAGTAGPGTAGAAGTGAAGIGDASAGASGAGAGGQGGTSSGSAGAGGAGGIGEDIPPWRGLNITVAPGLHVHTTPAGQTAGMDNRAAKMAGKLEVNLGGTSGGYEAYLGKRGFHVIGITEVNDCVGINDWSLGRDFDGNCRLNTLDGQPHGDQHTVTPDKSIMTQVFNALTTFEKNFPGEGWGYFLTKDLKGVRWSDTAFTGESHGAQNAACFAHVLRLYRAVAASGPRENTCGKGAATTDFDPNSPPWWPVAATCDATHCCLGHIASWIDAPSATPIERYYGFTGKGDTQFGDIMFTMERMNFIGTPVNVNEVAAPYNNTHRFYGNVGHVGLNDFPNAAVDIAFGVLPENANPTF